MIKTIQNNKIILLFWITSLGLTARAQETVPFSLTSSGHIIISAKVDGKEGNFIFDTGAGQNLFFELFAEKLQKKNSHHFFVGHRATGEAIRLPVYESKLLSLGDKEFKSQLYSTFDINIDGIDGILSIQAFENTPVIIDYERKELSFKTLTEYEKKHFIEIQTADYAGKALDIFTTVKLNDKITIQVLLDSGAGSKSFWIDASLAKLVSVDLADIKSVEKKSEFDATKIIKTYKSTLLNLSTENGLARIDNPSVNFVEGLLYEGKMSTDWLGKKIAISIPDKKIYLLK